VTAAPDLEALLPRLRSRAAEPERRTDVRPSELGASMATLDLGGLLAMGRDLGASLRNVVAANQEGRVDHAGSARALELERAMSTPAPSVLPGPAAETAVARAEADLGVTLTVALRRVYAEVADGGFGPGPGLLPLTDVVAEYRDLRRPDARLPHGRSWPAGLLPLVEREPGFDCCEAATGRIIAWDPEELSEHAGEDRFRRSFREIFPSVEAWLGDWVGSKTQAEQTADLMAKVMSDDAQVQMAREARAKIAKLSPEERTKMGLPEIGWERLVWGGLGSDEDETAGTAG
jgi:hypothetical protein